MVLLEDGTNVWLISERISLCAGKVEPPPAAPPIKLTEEEMERKSRSIIEEFLHLNDIKVLLAI